MLLPDAIRTTVTTCVYCRLEAEARPYAEGEDVVHPLYPADPLDVVLNSRLLRQSGFVLLHHACESPRINIGEEPYWNPATDWWACKEAHRPPNQYVHFDLGCEACARRWHAVREDLPPL